LYRELMNINNVVTLKSRLGSLILRIYARSVHHWNLTRNYLFAADSDSVGLSSFASTQRSHEKLFSVRFYVTVVQDHSRSSKLVPIECPYATSWWSSIVTICLSSVVSEITIYWSIVCICSPFLPTPVSFEAIARRIPLKPMV